MGFLLTGWLLVVVGSYDQSFLVAYWGVVWFPHCVSSTRVVFFSARDKMGFVLGLCMASSGECLGRHQRLGLCMASSGECLGRHRVGELGKRR